MVIIPIYDAFCTDFSNNGLGFLTPSSCIVEEEENGMYELTVEAPIDEEGRYALLQVGRIVKANCPVSDAVLYTYYSDQTVMEIWRVDASSIKLYKSPSTESAKLGKYKRGALLDVLDKPDGGEWWKVRMEQDGAVGYVVPSGLGYVTEVVISDEDPADIVNAQLSKAQLFRIYAVESDTTSGVVTASCQHVFYDMRGRIFDGEAEIESDYMAGLAIKSLFEEQYEEDTVTHHIIVPEVDFPKNKLSMKIDFKPFPEVLLDSKGLLEQCDGILYRDNFDFYVLPRREVDKGVTIRRGKNLTGLTMTVDMSETITDIRAYHKNKDGESIEYWSDEWKSPRYNDYPFPMVKKEDFDIQEGTEEYPDSTAVYFGIKDAIEKEYASGIDLPKVGMEVDFLLLGADEASEDYRKLQTVHMFDTVRVIDELIGADMKLRVTGYRWDVLAEQFESVTLGDIIDIAKA